MDEIREEFIAAEECLIEVLESYMEFADIVIVAPHNAMALADRAKKKWQPLLDELKAKHAQHTATVKDGKDEVI